MPEPDLNPKLMVIGDSLGQGCRSLSVKADLCAQSWGARVANAQGWPFLPPTHPRPVLFDLEREIRLLNPIALAPEKLNLGGFVGRYLQNLRDWEHQGPLEVAGFDNVALAGAAVGDVYLRTAKTCDDQIQKIIHGNPLNALNVDSVGDLHLSVNGRFVLNPSRLPEYENFSQMDWVDLRKPENLFVQLGHNHGLFEVGFSARIADTNDPLGSISQPGGIEDSYWGQWEKLALRLAMLPPGVKRIVIARLPKVGAVGNLMPASHDRSGGYAPAYNPTLSTSPRLRGPDLAKVDQAIVQANDRIEQILMDAAARTGTAGRMIFFDSYQLLEDLDYKNLGGASRRFRVNASVTADNRYLDGATRFGWPPLPKYQLARGGMFSIDGMHPSGLGYGVIASAVMTALGMNHNRAALLEQCYDEDKLLSNYPAELDMVVSILTLLRGAINVGHFDHQPAGMITDETHFADVLRVMKRAFIRK